MHLWILSILFKKGIMMSRADDNFDNFPESQGGTAVPSCTASGSLQSKLYCRIWSYLIVGLSVSAISYALQVSLSLPTYLIISIQRRP